MNITTLAAFFEAWITKTLAAAFTAGSAYAAIHEKAWISAIALAVGGGLLHVIGSSKLIQSILQHFGVITTTVTPAPAVLSAIGSRADSFAAPLASKK